MDDWKKFRTLGKKSVEEIIDKVHSLGLKFKYETKVEPEENKNNKETKSTSELLISKESEEKTEESSIVDKEVKSIDSNVQMTSQISEFDNKHIEICKKVDELNIKKKYITTVIKQLLKDLNAMNSNEVGKKSETAMKEISEMIQEHKIVLQDLDKTIAKMQKIEKDIRRERNKIAENSSKIIQERE